MVNEYGTSRSMADDESVRSDFESNDKVISTLNGLIETCKDGQEGFQTAAEGVERSDLKTLFYEFSQQRAEFAGVLQELVRSLGGDPEHSGSMSGPFTAAGSILNPLSLGARTTRRSLMNVNAAKTLRRIPTEKQWK